MTDMSELTPPQSPVIFCDKQWYYHQKKKEWKLFILFNANSSEK